MEDDYELLHLITSRKSPNEQLADYVSRSNTLQQEREESNASWEDYNVLMSRIKQDEACLDNLTYIMSLEEAKNAAFSTLEKEADKSVNRSNGIANPIQIPSSPNDHDPTSLSRTSFQPAQIMSHPLRKRTFAFPAPAQSKRVQSSEPLKGLLAAPRPEPNILDTPYPNRNSQDELRRRNDESNPWTYAHVANHQQRRRALPHTNTASREDGELPIHHLLFVPQENGGNYLRLDDQQQSVQDMLLQALADTTVETSERRKRWAKMSSNLQQWTDDAPVCLSLAIFAKSANYGQYTFNAAAGNQLRTCDICRSRRRPCLRLMHIEGYNEPVIVWMPLPDTDRSQSKLPINRAFWIRPRK